MSSHLIDDEVLIIADGGEMPEVTYHNCLYFLEADPEGPQITINTDSLLRLKRAVIEGYRKIILRDLTLDNRDKGLYRGLARTMVNWQRLTSFCQREGFDTSSLATEVRTILHHFLTVEHSEVLTRSRQTCINCTLTELINFFEQVDLDPSQLPSDWEMLLCLH
ncbi:MAG: hypothetical protein KKD63_06750 [Proteobacteria bacterium]|nr:hypothetical protein [Pseudomonadota bacterium]